MVLGLHAQILEDRVRPEALHMVLRCHLAYVAYLFQLQDIPSFLSVRVGLDSECRSLTLVNTCLVHHACIPRTRSSRCRQRLISNEVIKIFRASLGRQVASTSTTRQERRLVCDGGTA